MKDNKFVKIILCIILVVIIILSGIFIGYSFSNKINNSYNYKITYYDGFEPGINYDIYFYDDYKILVEKMPNCSARECIEGNYKPETSTYNINFSEKNYKYIDSFIKYISNQKNNLSNDCDEWMKINIYNKKNEKKSLCLHGEEFTTLIAIIYNDEGELTRIITID